MNNKERYNKAFSVLQTSKEINLEEDRIMKYNKKMKYKVAVASICGVVTLSISGVAVASNAFGLRNLVLPNYATTTEAVVEETTSEQPTTDLATSEQATTQQATTEERDPALAPVKYEIGESGWWILEIQGDEMKETFAEDSNEGKYIQKMVKKNIFDPKARYRMHYDANDMFMWITEMYDGMPEACDDYNDILANVMDVISLSGFSDTPEARASAEWNEFLSTYDRNKKILNENDKVGDIWGDDVKMYFVYSQEMADKLREIVGKYKLGMHKEISYFSNNEIEDLFGSGALPKAGDSEYGSGYSYDDGTVSYDGQYRDSQGYDILYQIRKTKKGIFDETLLIVGDVEDYEQEHYTTKDGVNVELAYSSSNGAALIMINREDSFITVNVSGGLYSKMDGDEYIDGEFTKERFMEFVDAFDFSVLK